MKGKEGDGNMESVLTQLQNIRTSDPVAVSLFNKIRSCSNLNNVQRTKALKVAALYCDKEGCSSDLHLDALSTGLALVKADLLASNSPASGATFAFVEACLKVVKKYAESLVCPHIDVVTKALEVLSIVNSATALRLFHEKDGITLKKIVTACLKNKSLKKHTVALISICITDSESGLSEVIMEESVTITIIQMMYPLLFNLDDPALQGSTLKVLERLIINKSDSWTSLPSWNKMKEDTQTLYYKDMISMVEKKQNWPDVWQFVVNMFGQELHSGGQLINHMLEVLERAFKHSDFHWTRVQAFACWETLIDNFKTGLRNKKRIDLIMIPLKANNHRIEALALAKLKTYDHLLKTLGKELISAPDILLSFLSFCFGSEKSCFPVKYYPALHEFCAKCINDVLSFPYTVEIFPKVNKELIGAVGDCFMMQNVSTELLAQIWDQQLELVQKVSMIDIVKNLLTMIHRLVAQAGGVRSAVGSTSGLGSPSGPVQPNSDLSQRIVSIVLQGIVHGKFALKSNMLKSRYLYIGSNDVKTSTACLLIMEWLLTPALVLSAGNYTKFKGLVKKVVSLQREELSSFMDFVHSTLKRLLMVDDNVSLKRQSQLYESTTDVWCTLVEETVKFVQNEGSINQGDAAQHDFSALYAVLMFPAQNLFVDLQLITKCSDPWSSLFYEAYQQAALIPTTTEQYFCEQVCIHLVGMTKQTRGSKQLASVYHFLTLILQVAINKFQSVKRLRQVQSHVSVTVKDLLSFDFDQEVVFNKAVSCLQHCLHPNTVSLEVISHVSSTICALLQSRVTTYDPVDKLCNLLNALKQASTHLNQHASSKVAVASLLQDIVQAGKCHPCQKVRSTIREICDTSDTKKTPEEEVKILNFPNGTVLSPSNRSPKGLVSLSPKSASKKVTAIQMSPSYLSPSNTKRKLQTTVCGADGKFVRIETPPKKIILTEHQKEVRRERRQDIPALYQDLSQDTQSLSQDSSQDCVALPVTPSKISKAAVPIDEDAVMDVVDVDTSIQVLGSKFQSPQRIESSRSTSKLKQSLEPKSDARSFTPPAGFVLPSSANDCSPRSENKCVPAKEPSAPKQAISVGKGSVDEITLLKPDTPSSTARRGALTRSSSNTDLRTRSGKILKRSSMVPEPIINAKKKLLPSRKSLPSNCSEELSKKNMVETVVIESDTTDTESVSSVTSDVISSNAQPLGTASRRRRSQKSLFQDSDSDVVEVKDPIIQNDNSEGSSKLKKGLGLKTLSPQQLSGNDEKQNHLPKKNVGGKILTRSRSNSSLDEVIGLGKKQKDSSPPSKSISPVESAPESIDINKANSSNSPRKKASSFEVTSAAGDKKMSSIQDGSAPKVNGGINLNSNQPLVEKQSAVELLALSNGQPGPSDKSRDSSKKGEEVPVKEFTRPNTVEEPCEKDHSISPSGSNVSGVDPEHCTEESQEIIESSQEPLLNLLKPCLVSLQQFKCSDLQQITHIEDVIVQRGADDKSPFKVRSMEVQFCPTAASSTRRALNMDAEKASSSVGKGGTAAAINVSSSPVKSSKSAQIAVSDEGQPLHADTMGGSTNDTGSESESLKLTCNSIQKGQDPASILKRDIKNDAKPDWMHAKKNSSPSKILPKMSSTSARRQAFMKSVRDGETSSSPPKGVDVSPMSSPVQTKRASKSVDSGNTTPIINRSSRAAQILGLGQAAAARGGDKVVAARHGEAVDENEAVTSRPDSISSLSVEVFSSIASSSITSSSIFNSSNTIANSILPSPSIRRQSKHNDLDLQKSTPQKCLEDGGVKEDWVPRTPCANTATPDSSILKRKRENDTDASSPSVKRKRVSFRDPPLSSMLRFGESVDVPGTVFCSDQSNGVDKTVESNCGNNEKSDDERVGRNGDCLNGEQIRSQETVEVQKKISSSEDDLMHQKLGEGVTVPDTSCPQLGRSSESNGFFGSPDADTQGMLDDLHRMPSCSSVYPTLVRCTHPVAAIIAKLTTAVWEKSLMRELSSTGVETIGDLAKLTEDKIDRLPLKPPKKTNVFVTLEDFESRHSSLRDGFSCGLKDVHCKATHGLSKTCVELKDALTNASVEDVVKVLAKLGKGAEVLQSILKSQQPQDVATAISSDEKILKALPMNAVVNLNDPQDVAALVSSNQKILKCLPVDAVINASDPKVVAAVVSSNPNVLQTLPVDIVLDSFQSQNVAAVVSSNPRILESVPLDVVINSKKPEDVAAIVNSNPEILGHIPVDVIINHNQPHSVAEIVCSNTKILKSLPLDVVIKSNKPDDVASIVSSNQQILKNISLELIINSTEPKDIAEVVSLNKNILTAIPLDASINSKQPQDVATFISSHHQILKCLPVDIVADTYISQACASTGKREEDMSVQELKWILNKVPHNVILETICPSVPNIISNVLKDVQRDYVLKQCSATEIVNHLDSDKADQILKSLLLKAAPQSIAGHFDSVRSKETIEVLLRKLNPKECLKFLLTHAQELSSFL